MSDLMSWLLFRMELLFNFNFENANLRVFRRNIVLVFSNDVGREFLPEFFILSNHHVKSPVL